MAQTGNHKGLTFGIFLAPFHRVGENPTLSMARDMELVEWIDELGFDEAWIGEHHSAGWETIASPEVFIGAAIDPPFRASFRMNCVFEKTVFCV